MHIKESIRADPMNELNEHPAKETMWYTIMTENRKKILIGNVYRSRSLGPENSEEINNVITAACKGNYHDILIFGDFNFPRIDWTRSCALPEGTEESKFTETLHENFLTQHINAPTRYRHNQQANILDLVINLRPENLVDIQNLEPLGKSDHRMLLASFDYKPAKLASKTVFKYHKTDWPNFKEFINQHDWTSLFRERNADECWNLFVELINIGINNFVPKTKLNPDKKQYPPWMNKEIKELRRQKKKLYRKYCKSRTRIDHINYKEVNNLLNKLIRKAQKEHELKIINESKRNPKAFWKYVKSKTKLKQDICELHFNGETATTDEQKAEALNSFFASVFTEEKLDTVPDLGEGPDVKESHKVNITKDKLLQELLTLNESKAPGPDGLHPTIFKNLAEEILDPLHTIFNKSLNESKVPESWKAGNITAIFKKGNRNLPSNYRPVSLTPIAGKIMEKFIRDALMLHMESNNLFAKEQHGFRHKRSCITNLLDNLNYITEELDKDNPVDSIYLDFRKAFDTVPHARLIKKLKHYKVDQNITQWIIDFLHNRKQRVVVNGTASSDKPVTSGIPQGSVLGPLLFLIFINDLPDCVSSMCYIFADDTKITKTVKNEEDRNILQKDLEALLRWSERWQLGFNADKCSVLHLGKKNAHFSYHVDTNKTLMKAENEKDLGVIMDKDLKFKAQIENNIAKANQILGIIKRNFKNASSTAKCQLYKSLVRSKLEYANCIWSPFLQGERDKIERVQRRATKFIVKKDLSYTERLKKLKLPTLEYRRLRGDLIQTFKFIHGYEKVDNLFTFTASSTRGHSLKLNKVRTNTTIRSNFFSIRVVNAWNSLPEKAVQARSVNSFKNHLDKHLQQKYDYKDW